MNGSLRISAQYQAATQKEGKRKEKKKEERNRKIEDRGDNKNTKQTFPNPHMLQAQLAFALIFIPAVIMPIQRRRCNGKCADHDQTGY